MPILRWSEELEEVTQAPDILKGARRTCFDEREELLEELGLGRVAEIGSPLFEPDQDGWDVGG